MHSGASDKCLYNSAEACGFEISSANKWKTTQLNMLWFFCLWSYRRWILPFFSQTENLTDPAFIPTLSDSATARSQFLADLIVKLCLNISGHVHICQCTADSSFLLEISCLKMNILPKRIKVQWLSFKLTSIMFGSKRSAFIFVP